MKTITPSHSTPLARSAASISRRPPSIWFTLCHALLLDQLFLPPYCQELQRIICPVAYLPSMTLLNPLENFTPCFSLSPPTGSQRHRTSYVSLYAVAITHNQRTVRIRHPHCSPFTHIASPHAHSYHIPTSLILCPASTLLCTNSR